MPSERSFEAEVNFRAKPTKRVRMGRDIPHGSLYVVHRALVRYSDDFLLNRRGLSVASKSDISCVRAKQFGMVRLPLGGGRIVGNPGSFEGGTIACMQPSQEGLMQRGGMGMRGCGHIEFA